MRKTHSPDHGRNSSQKSFTALLLSCLIIIPFTAILHNVVFYTHMCMLNPFGFESFSTYKDWLMHDPSLPWALFLVALLYQFTNQDSIKIGMISFIVGFTPLSIWIWDIPFTNRLLCRTFHDDQLILPLLGIVHSKHFYFLGAVITTLLFIFLSKKRFPALATRIEMESI